jgi:hypothetical protein
MKRLTLVSLIISIMLILCACSSNIQPTYDSEQTALDGKPAISGLAKAELRFPEDFTVDEIKLPKAKDDQIYNAVFTHEGNICVNFSRSLVFYDKQHKLIKTIDNPQGVFVLALAADKKGNVYAGGNKGEENFISVYSSDGKLLKAYKNLFTSEGPGIVRQIVLDKAGNMLVVVKYGSVGRYALAAVNPTGQLTREFLEGNVTPRTVIMGKNDHFYVSCWYDDAQNPPEPRFCQFSGIGDMKYPALESYRDYTAFAAEDNSAIDKNGLLYSSGKVYHDDFSKACDINVYDTPYDFSNCSVAGWTTDNNGNAVFWAGLVMTSGGGNEKIPFNTNLYRVRLK